MIKFLKSKPLQELRVLERAISLLWWHSREDHNASKTPKELCDELEMAGYARPNVTNLREALERDKRTVVKDNRFRLKVNKRADLDTRLAGHVADSPLAPSNAVIDMGLLGKARGYNSKTAAQINGSYEARLWDCCAVMCRRLVESLIIDAYETAGRDAEIKGADGNFLMLKGMVAKIKSANALNIGRNAQAGLERIKELGDLSAHSRRYNARASDIDLIKHDLRVVIEDLLHLSGQA